MSVHKRLSEVVNVAGRQYDRARRVNDDIYVYWPCLEVRISKDGIYYMDYTGPQADKFYEILQDEDAHSALRFGVHRPTWAYA